MVSIHRFCARRSAVAGAADCTITLPLLPARSDADCAACCAAMTFWFVVVRLLCREMIDELCEVRPASVCATRASRDCVADASALVWAARLRTAGAAM
ncbi:hypothetical protein D3C76_947210 [compost metagenome]